MEIKEIITKKKNKIELNEREIKYVIENFVSDDIKDYQMSSLLMAIVINGLTEKETINFTKYMIESGDKLNFDDLGNVVDKHSTGGVGDKTTLIVAPLVASCNVKVAKMSGRSLGYTGGTIDKLESIDNIKLNLDEEEFINQLKKIGVAITSQTKNIAYADKKIYALRDATSTVESIGLIASSIMSKKIAMGTKKIVIDVKVGNGALVKNIEDARKLSKLMIKIGKEYDVEVLCILTNMNNPLGNNIGNSLEVEEAIDVLKDNKKGNLRDICIIIATCMVKMALNIDLKQANKMVIRNLENKSAYYKFLELIKEQHGNLATLSKAKNKLDIIANKSGYLKNITADKLAKLSFDLGAGRINKEDAIDYNAGVVLNYSNNDYVEKGSVVLTLYSNKEINITYELEISDTKGVDEDLVYEIIG